ncbi:MAG: hypothetical protein QOD07_2415 [Frankiaceae bacterium]|nr:hypothetical protein [Frankiaceae bacterium]
MVRQRFGVTNDDMTAVLECAALAPSVHNTQPWRFDVAGDTIEVRAERDRQLSYLDPTGRQLHVSCGAAIEFAFLAARSIGRECTVRLLPDGGDPDLLARIQLGRARVATPTERLLAEAIPLRYTDRGPYTDRAVPADLVDDVRARAADLDVWIRTVDDADDRRALVTVLSVAEQSEAADARYGEELARWTGTDGDVGVPADAVAGRWPSDRVSHVPLRDFTGHASQPSVEGRGDASPPSVERDFLLMLGTPDDDPLAWLSAGRALGWALLCAASVGVSAQPLGPATDLPHARATLRHDLGLVGYPQFVVRMGYGTDRPRTRRRHVVPA